MITGTVAIIMASFIWGTVIFYYKKLMYEEDYIALNFKRVLFAMLISFPFVVYNLSSNGIIYSVVSGVFGLGIGDTLYFYAILKNGASVAAPVAYTYVVLSQIVASFIGERVGFYLIIASIFAFLGVSLISINEKRKISNIKGVLAAFLAGVSWMLSAIFIKQASMEEASVGNIAFFRLGGATLFLGVMNFLVNDRKSKSARITELVRTKILPLISFVDMFIGASLYSLGVSVLGVSKTVIIISLSPVITIVFAKIFKIENINTFKVLGTLLIVLGIVLSQFS